MGVLKVDGILPYYVKLTGDYKKKVFSHNKKLYQKIPLHYRINLKSWYPLSKATTANESLMAVLHLINMDFCQEPNIGSSFLQDSIYIQGIMYESQEKLLKRIKYKLKNKH